MVTVEAPAAAWAELEPKVVHTIEHLFEYYGDERVGPSKPAASSTGPRPSSSPFSRVGDPGPLVVSNRCSVGSGGDGGTPIRREGDPGPVAEVAGRSGRSSRRAIG